MRPLVSLEFSAKDALKAVQREDAVIVIDVLRCCSTIVTALVKGAEGVIPTKTVKEARRLHKKHPEFILAGERGVLIGALLNTEAVAKAALKIVEKEKVGISLVLSGREGKHFSLEDFLCAGLMVENFPTDRVELSDAAVGSWLAFQQSRRSLYETIQDGYHARSLKSIGFEEDTRFCSQVNVFDIVPIYRNGMIIPLDLNLL